jgi:hypothetical protein
LGIVFVSSGRVSPRAAAALLASSAQDSMISDACAEMICGKRCAKRRLPLAALSSS